MYNLSMSIVNSRCFFTRTIPVLCLFNITNPVHADNEAFALRINTGGAEYTDSAGHLWQADKGFNTGRLSGSATGVIYSGTDDQELYQSGRWDAGAAPELRYSFEVPDGTYLVRLHFADSWSGTQGEGLRIFDVLLENKPALESLDIFSEVGGNAALVKTLTIQVNDGALNIEFLHQVQNPEVRAIEIKKIADRSVNPDGVNIILEAEEYTAFNDANPGVDSFNLDRRTDASGGVYMQSVGKWGESYLEYEFELPVDDVYEIGVRGSGVSSGTNSFRISIDAGVDSVVQLNTDDSWGWKTISDSDSGLGPYSLSAGRHTLRLKKRERNAKIDQLKITNTATRNLPVASFSPSFINFSSQDIGSVSNVQSVILTNDGNAPLNIAAISTKGDFNESNDCGDVLVAGDSCSIDIRFAPSSAGSITGELVIDGDNVQVSPYRISLTGLSLSTDAICGEDSVGKNGTYFSENFECADWNKNYRTWGGTGPVRETGEAARSGEYGIKMSVSTGEHWGGVVFFDHSKHGQTGNFNEIWTRYYVKFGANWGRNDPALSGDVTIGKAGYRARSDEVGKCLAPCLEMSDSNLVTPAGDIIGTSYWHRDMSESYLNGLESKRFLHKKKNWSAARKREQWYCIESHHVLNTPSEYDGVYQNYLNGVLVSDVQNARHRMSPLFNIDNSVLIAYVGGQWVSDRDMVIYFDDWATSDKRIGCQ